MNAFLTETSFRLGVAVSAFHSWKKNKKSSAVAFFTQEYLKKYAYKTAKQDDLWYELTIQAHRDDTLEKNLTVKQIMDTWTLQKGFPVVNVQRLNDSNLFKLSQKWFLLDSTVPSSNINKPKWFVPFSYTTSKQNNFTFESEVIWLKPNQNEGKIRASIRRIIL